MTQIILGIITIAVLIALSVQDIRERMIYSFPVLFLAAVWMIYSVAIYRDNLMFLIISWSVCIAVYAAFKVLCVWGDGDSDMFLLFTGIIICSFKISSLQQFWFIESTLLVVTMIAALLVGLIEYLVMRKKLSKQADIAVIPGFMVVLTGAIVYGSLWKMGVIAV